MKVIFLESNTKQPSNPFSWWLSVLIGSNLAGIFMVLNGDHLFGAVYLRLIHEPLGVAVASLCAYSALLFLMWARMSREAQIGWSLVGLVLVMCATVTSPIFAPFGWLIATILSMFPSHFPFGDLPFVLIAIVVILFALVISIRHLQPSKLPSKLIILSTLLLTTIYSLGIAGKTQVQSISFPSSVQLNNRVYVLYLVKRWVSSSPDHIYLYECNQLIMFCQDVYDKPDGFYTYEGLKKLALVSDSSSNTVSILVDNETLYTHRQQS